MVNKVILESNVPKFIVIPSAHVEVLQALADGWAPKQIRVNLNISHSTYKRRLTGVSGVATKMGTGTLAHTIAESFRQGLIT